MMKSLLEEQFPQYRTLLVYYCANGTADSEVVLGNYFSESSITESRQCITELKEVLELSEFPWEEVRDLTNLLPPGKDREVNEAEYRAWMQEVLQELEKRVAKMEDDSV